MSRLLLLSFLLQAIAIVTSMTVSAQAGKGTTSYSVGVAGTPWGATEKVEWRDTRKIQRSYKEEVVEKIQALKDRFEVEQYGALSQDPERYPLYVVRSKGDFSGDNNNKPCILITGGVHGYETSGVQGALLFLDQHAKKWQKDFRILVFPCISPWGYETIQRWNCHAVDPNRSFNPDGEHVEERSFNPEAATEESSALMAHLKKIAGESGQDKLDFVCHLDLHETTDSDALEFRPAKAARDGILDPPPDVIPDGFYLVSDSTKTPETVGWYTSMIEKVKKVTHIAPPEEDGTLIGEKIVQEGVIAIPSPKTLGLCAGVTEAPFATTTEVYPDSATATPEICNEAQVACIEGALEYIQKSYLPAANTA
jgi:hypothetical protein